jgi:hypothetical protein
VIEILGSNILVKVRSEMESEAVRKAQKHEDEKIIYILDCTVHKD